MSVASPNAHVSLKRIRAYIARMPSLSTTVTKVLETCNNPNSSPNDLNRVISLDPVLAGQVLKLINSAYYALPHTITSLTRAIIMLGLNTVKNLALSLAILETMSSKRAFSNFSANDFWAHCLCVGVTARCLSALKGASFAEREDYFLAGLLHDLGKIPLNRQLREHYRGALDVARREQRPLVDVENEVLGFSHCAVGELIAQKWQLGSRLIQSFACHHHPDEAAPAERPFVLLVALANGFANHLKVGSSGDCSATETHLVPWLEQTGLDWKILDALQEQVFEAIEKAKIFLEISRHR